MIVSQGLPFIRQYVETLNEAIKAHEPSESLSRIQCIWISFVILGVLVTNTLCWTRFEQWSIGSYKAAAICWVFRRAKIAWDLLLMSSTLKLIEAYGIRYGVLAVDDTDSQRSKRTVKIAKVHKIRDKKRSGFFSGQNILFLVLITDKITVPVGFEFYEPDPVLSAWRKEDKRLRQKRVAKRYRPKQPERDPSYPTKIALGLKLVNTFVKHFKEIRIKAVVADTAYNTREFFEGAAQAAGQNQVISQIKKTQKINVHGRYVQVQTFFANYEGKPQTMKLRHSDKQITYCAAKFKVKSHDKKQYVIALKYEGEDKYRYLVANDTTWRDIDVIKAYALRWLVEVFIQDWKSYEGWDKLAMQQGIEGSERGLILSLLSDHALHFHPDQSHLCKNKEPAATVGSLRKKVIMESLTAFIDNIVNSNEPKILFKAYASKIAEVFELSSSSKHLRHVDFEGLQPMQ